MTIYSLGVLLFLFGSSLLFHVRFQLLLLDLHTSFLGGRSGGLVAPIFRHYIFSKKGIGRLKERSVFKYLKDYHMRGRLDLYFASPPRPPGPRAPTPSAVSAPEARSTAAAGSRSDPRGRSDPRCSVRAWGEGQALGPAPGAPQRLDPTPYAPATLRGLGVASLIPKDKAPPRPQTPASPLPELLTQSLGFQPGTPALLLLAASPWGSPHASTSPMPPHGSSCTRPGGHARPWNGGHPSLRQPSRPSSQATGRCER